METLTIVLINDAILILIAILFLRFLMGKLPDFMEFFKENLKISLEQWLNSDQGRKALYSIGALVGHGAMAGSGIPKTSGKFKWENFIGELASSWIQQNIVKTPIPGESSVAPPPKISDKGLGSA